MIEIHRLGTRPVMMQITAFDSDKDELVVTKKHVSRISYFRYDDNVKNPDEASFFYNKSVGIGEGLKPIFRYSYELHLKLHYESGFRYGDYVTMLINNSVQLNYVRVCGYDYKNLLLLSDCNEANLLVGGVFKDVKIAPIFTAYGERSRK